MWEVSPPSRENAEIIRDSIETATGYPSIDLKFTPLATEESGVYCRTFFFFFLKKKNIHFGAHQHICTTNLSWFRTPTKEPGDSPEHW